MSVRAPQTIQLGPATFDPDSGWITHNGGRSRVRPYLLPLFRILARNKNRNIPAHTLRQIEAEGGTDLRHLKSDINNRFLKGAGLISVMKVIGAPKDALCLQVNDNPMSPDYPSTALTIHPVDFTLSSAHNAGFCVSFDSAMINHVWELITNQGALDGVIRSCHRTFRSCLEAFAFAIVYSSKIASGKNFRQSYGGQRNDQRIEFLEGLGELWMHQNLPEDVREGALLQQVAWRNQIKRDMQSVSRCIELESWPFKEAMTYAAYRHLGKDDSLRIRNLPLKDYRFDSDPPYYEDAELQSALGISATRQLARFLRDGIASGKEDYAESALQHFVSLNFLTHITIMREYHVGCLPRDNNPGLYRLSHAMRSVILGTTTYDHNTEQQRLLRNLVVQHTLFTAFKSVHSISRQSLISTLKSLREEKHFRKMREILEHDHLIMFHPSEESERKARSRIQEIWRCADPQFRVSESYGVDGFAIMRDIGKSSARLYESELYRTFPELRPTQLT